MHILTLTLTLTLTPSLALSLSLSLSSPWRQERGGAPGALRVLQTWTGRDIRQARASWRLPRRFSVFAVFAVRSEVLGRCGRLEFVFFLRIIYIYCFSPFLELFSNSS